MPANRSTRRKTTQAVKKAAKKAPAARKSVKVEAEKVRSRRVTERTQRKGVTTAAGWKKGRVPVLLELPESGNVVQAINKGLNPFLKAGKIPNSLMPLIEKALNEAEGKGGINIGKDVVKDPALIAAAVDLANAVCVESIVEPKFVAIPTVEVHHPPDKDHPGEGGWTEEVEMEYEDRPTQDPNWHEEILYADDIDINDRFFIMNWAVGGTSEVEQFHSELASSVADVQHGVEAGEDTG